ncbi:MAG: serine/threonine protein kinase, partial [Myxococcales bacterium]|nr:serine/threonine protein kinase [Myxococcales bacterium]
MSALAPGAVLDGRFRLVAPLGGGGAATVWQAHDAATEAQVAVKLLHPKFRAHAGVRARLAQEARLLAEFEHPHLARALAFALEAEVPYFVLELVRGVSLEEALAERAPAGWIALQDGLRILGQVASAVDYAHARGVVHRDLKPANIMLAPEGAKVLDFGIAKLLEVSDPSFATTQGRVLGSGFYMAPEQALDTAAVSPQADVFALGTVAFELLTSRRAWVEGPDGGPVAAFAEALPNTERNRLGAVLARMLDAPRPRACALRPELPRAVDEVLGRAMAPLPEGRFASAGAFFEALAAAVEGVLDLQDDLPELPDTFVRAGLPETVVRERAELEGVPDTLVRAGPADMLVRARAGLEGVPSTSAPAEVGLPGSSAVERGPAPSGVGP